MDGWGLRARRRDKAEVTKSGGGIYNLIGTKRLDAEIQGKGPSLEVAPVEAEMRHRRDKLRRRGACLKAPGRSRPVLPVEA